VVDEKLYQNIIESVTSAAENVFQTMIFMDIKSQAPFERKGLDSLSDITGIISLTGDIIGSIAISMDTNEAREVISNMLGDEITDVQEIIDGVGEITNLIVGMAKTVLSELSCQFEISVPIVVTGKGVNIKHYSAEAKSLTSIPFYTEDRSFFQLELYLKE